MVRGHLNYKAVRASGTCAVRTLEGCQCQSANRGRLAFNYYVSPPQRLKCAYNHDCRQCCCVNLRHRLLWHRTLRTSVGPRFTDTYQLPLFPQKLSFGTAGSMSSAEEDYNDDNGSEMNNQGSKKRRVQRACDICRRKKSKRSMHAIT